MCVCVCIFSLSLFNMNLLRSPRGLRGGPLQGRQSAQRRQGAARRRAGAGGHGALRRGGGQGGAELDREVSSWENPGEMEIWMEKS